MPVPLFATSHERYTPELRDRLGAVIAGGRYILGPEVEEFEREFATYLGAEHCIGVANGTDAITIALKALGVQPGDEVVMPSFTFYATAEASVNAGAKPIFCDIDPDTYCITAETVERAITPATKAIIAVHLFGNVAPVPELRRFGLPILEDSAQAAGASLNGTMAGALGDAATFSFFPSKNLFCLGDGGAVTTNDAEVAARVKRLRFHGSEDKQTFVDVGFNSRLDELQAAALRVFLPSSTAGPRRDRRWPRATPTRGWEICCNCPVPSTGADPRLPPLRRALRSVRRAPRGSRRRGGRGSSLLPPAGAPPTRHEALCGRHARPSRHPARLKPERGVADGYRARRERRLGGRRRLQESAGALTPFIFTGTSPDSLAQAEVLG